MAYRPGGAKRDWRERFIEKVDRRGDDECWPWLGAVRKTNGYGAFGRATGVVQYAHVTAIEYATGEPVPKEMWVDHVFANGCSRRDCVNWVSHLEVVPPGENLRRARGDVCSRGHDRALHSYTRTNGQRYCRVCERDNQRRRRGCQRESEHERGARGGDV